LRRTYNRTLWDEFLVLQLLCGAANGRAAVQIQDEEWRLLLTNFHQKSRFENFLTTKSNSDSALQIIKKAKRKLADTETEAVQDSEKRNRTEETQRLVQLTEDEIQRLAQLTEDEERIMLYEIKGNEIFQPYSLQITKLTAYVLGFVEEPNAEGFEEDPLAHFETGMKMHNFLKENHHTKFLVRLMKKYLHPEDRLTQKMVEKVYHNATVQNESLILDAINSKLNTNPSVTLKRSKDWKDFLQSIPLDLNTVQIRLTKLGSDLHTFPADASQKLTIHNLTSRLKALQDW
jgi:hypothetical protein